MSGLISRLTDWRDRRVPQVAVSAPPLFTDSEFLLTPHDKPIRLCFKAECYRSVVFSQQRLSLQFQQQELATPAQLHRAAPRTIDGALPLGDVGLRPASSLDLGPSMTASSKSVEW